MLERRDDASGFEASYVGGSDRCDEIRVFADRLLDAAPSVVAGNVENRSKTLVDADGAHRLANLCRHGLDENRIERGTPCESSRVDRCSPGHEAGQALVGPDREYSGS